MICRSDYKETLLVTAVMLKKSDQMKSTRTSNFAFIFHELYIVVITHGDNNMFSRWTFCSYLNMWLQF